MLLLVFTAACSDEFDQPPMVVPTATHHANMTIAEFKAKHWQDDRNYIDTVKEDEIIHGWVTSSDESGNVYKSLYIMDESGYGLSISINQNSLYNNYRIGQEVVLPMKGYFVGKYNGQQQLGYPQWYAAGSAWEATFLPQAMWESLVEINGLPDLTKVDTLEVSLSEFVGKSDPETLMKYQGRLVRINGVTFDDADGVATYSEAGSSTNRNITDDEGLSLIVRNSNYADFRADILPEGEVDVVGLLGSYGTNWQLVLRSAEDVIGGGSMGTNSNPYPVADAILAQGTGAKGWVRGYIVGAVAPEVTSVSSNSDIEWKAPTTLDNTLVIADDPECKDYTKCIVIPLAQGSTFRESANLKDNAVYYKQPLKVKAKLANFMGMAGAIDVEDFALPFARPVTQLDEGFVNGIPSTWSNVTVSGPAKWSTYAYPASAPTTFTAQFRYTSSSSEPIDAWLITPPLDIANATSKAFSFSSEVNKDGHDFIEVYVLNSADPNSATVKVKLNPVLPTHPTNGNTYSSWTPSGDLDLSQWSDGIYYVGFRFSAPAGSGYSTWCINNVKFGLGGDTPPPTIANRGDFETMGTPSGQYNTWTSSNGWVATNSMLLAGGDKDSNPNFIFIGFMTGSDKDYAYAPTLNGKTTSVGTLVSPVIHGGMTKLQFSYGAAMSDKLLSFKVDVKQNGSVVKTWTVENSNVTQRTAYTFAENCSINGDFTIEITNLCPSNSTSNKDRVSIWNLVWDPAQ